MIRAARRPLLIAAAALAAAFLLAAAPVSAAGDPTVGPHTGNLGVHTLVDTSDYPGATCIYDPGLHLKTIKIRQPIVYAFDRTSKTDTEWVAWRYHIEYSSSDAPPEQYVNWPDFAVSSWTKVKATDLDNARWTSGTYTMGSGSGSHPFYRVSIELRWFFPSSSTKDGNAVHVVNNYRIKDSGGQVTVQVACPQSVALGGSAGMAGASGTFGVHVLLDTAEYPAVTCTFHNFDPRDDLMRITVRPPVLYAVDRASKTDTQKVGWRFRVQATDVPTPTESDWFDVYVAPIVKVTATDAYNGQWKARSFAISNGIAHDDWRAVVDMYWYNPSTGHQAGKAIEFPVNYLQAWGDQSALFGRQSCGETLG